MKLQPLIIELIKKSNKLLCIVAFIYSFNTLIKVKYSNRNKIILDGAFIKKTKFKINGNGNKIYIAKENRLENCYIYINGNNCNVSINTHCILKNLEIWLEDDFSKIEIDCNTTVEGGHFAATEGKFISIGNDCMFSKNIEIRNGDSHSICALENNERINVSKSIRIGNHVWLAADVKILKGVEVGDGTVIATGAILTKNADSNSIYSGIPAIKNKGEIFWKRIRI